MLWFKDRKKSEEQEGEICAQSLSCPGCPNPCGPRGPRGKMGPMGPIGPTGATGPTAPSIYAQQGKCRNHAAFSTLKTIKQPL